MRIGAVNLSLALALFLAAIPTRSLAGSPNDGTPVTYTATASGLVAANSGTDIFSIQPGAGKTVHLRRLTVGGTASAATAVEFQLIKRSTNDTGGTSTLITPVASDNSDAAGTAAVRSFTANPASLGTSEGIIGDRIITLTPATSSSLATSQVVFDYTASQMLRTPTISGTEEIDLNFVTQTVSGNKIYIEATWTEE